MGRTRVYVGHLSSRTMEDELDYRFGNFGPIRSVDLKQGFAFVVFSLFHFFFFSNPKTKNLTSFSKRNSIMKRMQRTLFDHWMGRKLMVHVFLFNLPEVVVVLVVALLRSFFSFFCQQEKKRKKQKRFHSILSNLFLFLSDHSEEFLHRDRNTGQYFLISLVIWVGKTSKTCVVSMVLLSLLMFSVSVAFSKGFVFFLSFCLFVWFCCRSFCLCHGILQFLVFYFEFFTHSFIPILVLLSFEHEMISNEQFEI